MRKLGAIGALLVLVALGWLAWGWFGASEVEEDTAFTVPSGASLTQVAALLEEDGHIASADAFLLRAKIMSKLLGGAPIKAGEFMLPAGASGARILSELQFGEAIRRFLTIPEC
jgi:UPF0755 protein